MKPILLPAATLVAASLASCVFSIGGTRHVHHTGDHSPAAHERRTMRRQLQDLAIGMSRSEVDATLGTDRVYIGDDVGWIDRPFQQSHYTAADGRRITVLSYYTDLRERDGVISDDELTPVVLADGAVIGWGRDYPLPPGR